MLDEIDSLAVNMGIDPTPTDAVDISSLFISTVWKVAICLFFSAMFALAETSFFSISKLHVKKLEKENTARSRRILKLLEKPKQLLITILLGNTLVNIYATAQATLFAIEFTQTLTSAALITLVPIILVVIMTILLLFIGDIIPKLFAFTRPVKVANVTYFLIYPMRTVLYPIIIAVEWFIMKISAKKSDDQSKAISHEDIRNIVQSDANTSTLEENEKKILDKIFRFTSITAREVMVPRVDMVGVEISSSIEEVKKIFVDTGYSRIPVYKKTIDEISGIIYAKDLILFPEKSNIHALQRKVDFIPENMKIQVLLNQFQSKKKLIAIVVDEYGGTSGLVTLEDILEELVGEIMDEYDDEQPMITKLNEHNYLISAMVQVTELNRVFSLNLNEEYDNLAELLYAELNHIPAKNEKYVFNNAVEFIITQLKKQRISFVKMKLLRNEESNEGE